MGGGIQRIPRRLSRGILRISLAGGTALLISMVPCTSHSAGSGKAKYSRYLRR